MYVANKLGLIKSKGVITIARVEYFKGASDGSDLHINVYYNGTTYKNVIDEFCRCNGKFFFVKIEKNNPEGYIIFYKDKPVPDCILKRPIPITGWSDFTVCSEK